MRCAARRRNAGSEASRCSSQCTRSFLRASIIAATGPSKRRLDDPCGPRRQRATALDTRQIVLGQRPRAQWRRQQVRRRDRVLNRKVDADTEDRGHRVGGVADAQQSGAVPAAQAVEPHVEQFHVVPGGDGVAAVGQPRDGGREPGQEALQALGAALGSVPFGMSAAHCQ